MMGYGWGMGAGGMVAMTIFWVALVVLVVWLVMRVFPGGTGRTDGQHGDGTAAGTPRESPEQILDRRYAAGEIDLETYRTMRTELTSARSTGRPAGDPPRDGGAP